MQATTVAGSILVALLASVPSLSSAASSRLESSSHARSPLDADPISGEWDVTFHLQDTKTAATFTLTLDGNKATGTCFSDHTGPGTLRDGMWIENKLSFKLDFAKHDTIDLTGTLRDGMLVGEFRTEGFVDKWEARRKPAQRPQNATTPAPRRGY